MNQSCAAGSVWRFADILPGNWQGGVVAPGYRNAFFQVSVGPGEDQSVSVVLERAEEEPPAPSAAVPGMDSDLEAIILMAMAKERERRYPTAKALGKDLERYLKKKPVYAQPDSGAYRVQKWFVRHRRLAIVAGISLLAVAGVSAWALTRIKKDKAVVRDAREDTREAVEEARKAGTKALALATTEEEKAACREALARLGTAPP
mgnify:CR=1 FL=1